MQIYNILINFNYYNIQQHYQFYPILAFLHFRLEYIQHLSSQCTTALTFVQFRFSHRRNAFRLQIIIEHAKVFFQTSDPDSKSTYYHQSVGVQCIFFNIIKTFILRGGSTTYGTLIPHCRESKDFSDIKYLMYGKGSILSWARSFHIIVSQIEEGCVQFFLEKCLQIVVNVSIVAKVILLIDDFFRRRKCRKPTK